MYLKIKNKKIKKSCNGDTFLFKNGLYDSLNIDLGGDTSVTFCVTWVTLLIRTVFYNQSLISIFIQGIYMFKHI